MPLLIVSSERFGDHVTPPGHPERPARAEVMDGVAAEWRRRGAVLAAPRPAARSELARIHGDPYLDMIAATAGRSVSLDPDTYTSPESHDVAQLAAGAALLTVEHVMAGRGSAFAMVRPPGHHAERSRAMGFCLYNNAAVAAATAVAGGLRRVALVDYDVHHGNGSQWAFYDDPRVLYVSTHQYPFYPGTGAADEVGRDRGRGFTLNIPLEAGCRDEDYDHAFQSIVVPVLDEFAPELLILSAGFDAHERDPLAGMRLTADGYANLTRHLLGVATRHCGGRLAAVTEGGYDLQALAACLNAVIGVLHRSVEPRAVAGKPSGPAVAAIEAVRRAQKPFWRAL